MSEFEEAYPFTAELLEREVEDKVLTKGAQIALVYDGELVLSDSLGDDGLGREVTPSTVFRVYCTIKPVTALAVAKLVDQGVMDLDAPLGDLLPDVASVADGQVALRDVLSHAAGLHLPTAVEVELVPPDRRAALFTSVVRPPGWRVGIDVAYSERYAWQVVGMAIERATGEPLREHLRASILDPLGLTDTWIGMTDDEYRAVIGRLGANHDMRNIQTYPLLLERGARMCTEVNPAHGGYSTALDLAHLYAALLTRLAGDGPDALASAETLRTFTTAARPASYDHILGRTCQHGLGFLVGLADHAFGPHVSPGSFGHSGNVGSSFAWADPAHDLAGALVFNGIVDHETAFVRRRALVRAIYRDLDLIDTDPAPSDDAPDDDDEPGRRWRFGRRR